MAVATGCLYSVVKNVSGRKMNFPFLPPHGRELANNATISVPGDIRQEVLHARTLGRPNMRRFNALARALGNNATNTVSLEIISTPNQIVYDDTDNVSYMLLSDNATVGVADPCWHESV